MCLSSLSLAIISQQRSALWESIRTSESQVGLLQAARVREAQVCEARALDQELHARTGALEADDPEKDLQGPRNPAWGTAGGTV